MNKAHVLQAITEALGFTDALSEIREQYVFEPRGVSSMAT